MANGLLQSGKGAGRGKPRSQEASRGHKPREVNFDPSKLIEERTQAFREMEWEELQKLAEDDNLGAFGPVALKKAIPLKKQDAEEARKEEERKRKEKLKKKQREDTIEAVMRGGHSGNAMTGLLSGGDMNPFAGA